MNETVLEKFLRYVKYDTQSSETSGTYPSTAKQWELLHQLVKELKELGVPQVNIDEYGYVMATLPSNLPATDAAFGKVPKVGIISHVDTSPSASGENVKAQVFTYNGGDIVLPGDNAIVIRANENLELKNNIGKTIVTTDGTTLLGADDKAGVAIIMTAIQNFIRNPHFLHGDIQIGFTPDEEIGAGTKYFDIKKFGADTFHPAAILCMHLREDHYLMY